MNERERDSPEDGTPFTIPIFAKKGNPLQGASSALPKFRQKLRFYVGKAAAPFHTLV